MRLAVLGASGHGRVVADAARLAGWTEILWFDDGAPDPRAREGAPLSGGTADLLAWAGPLDGCVVAIGHNATRLARHRELAQAGFRLATIVHPRATVAASAVLGAGTVVFAGAVVNPGAELGVSCIVNTGATVDHDCRLADGAHVSPGAHLGGAVRVGARSWVGIGASVIQGIAIGEDALVAAGSVVVRDVPAGTSVGGVPARRLITGAS